MEFIQKNDGVTLAYEDIGSDPSAILFVHGWGCDHTNLAPQAEFFSRSHRVVSVDLRGHGQSDAPWQDYSMATFADDLAWLCAEIGLEKPVVAGHSMGGNVVLELAARHPGTAGSIVLIDPILLPRQIFVNVLRPFVEAVQGESFVADCQNIFRSMCLATDDEARKTQLIDSLPNAPQHVLASLTKSLLEYDVMAPVAACRVPVAYIGTANPAADLVQLRSLAPQLVTAQTLGSGHFCTLFVPDQINAMLSAFLKVYALQANNERSESIQSNEKTRQRTLYWNSSRSAGTGKETRQ